MMLGASVFIINSAHKDLIDYFIGRHSTQQPTDVFTLCSQYVTMSALTALCKCSVSIAKYKCKISK